MSISDFIVNRIYSEYFPPSLGSFSVIIALWCVFALLSLRWGVEPFTTFVLTTIAFMPILCLVIYFIALTGVFGSAGHVGIIPVDCEPEQVGRRHMESFLTSGLITLILLLATFAKAFVSLLRTHNPNRVTTPRVI